jgi:hypothetical protein
MPTIKSDETKSAIKSQLAQTRSEFHTLLNSLSEEDLKRRSKNEGWTNGEILFHMMFAFLLILTLVPMMRLWSRLPKKYSKGFANVLNFSTAPFNWINGLAPHMGGNIFTRNLLRVRFDKVYTHLIRLVDSVKENEWESGMYYPDKWEPLFDEYMTMEKLLYYPIRHFRFHVDQLSR